MRGGRREGAGRPKGTKSVISRKIIRAEAAQQDFDVLGWLVSIVRDDTIDLNIRIKCCGVALPYIHPRLSTVDVNVSKSAMTHEQMLSMFDDAIDITPTPSPAPEVINTALIPSTADLLADDGL